MCVRRLVGSLGLFLLVALQSAGANEGRSLDAEQIAFMQLSGSELVEDLRNELRRSRAYYELWCRADPSRDEGFERFAQSHYEPEVLVCPQDSGQSPLYAVISTAPRNPDADEEEFYEVKNPDELFPPARTLGPRRKRERPRVEVYTSDGRRTVPIGEGDVLWDVLADVNGDGLIERVGIHRYYVEGMKEIGVLEVSAVKEQEQPLFAVLFNWGADEWSYRITDEDSDGIWDIEIGPCTTGGFKPRASWRWDASKKGYAGPSGRAGEHFRVLNVRQVAKDLARFKAGKLKFPKDPEAVTEEEETIVGKPPPASLPLPTEPYQYASLKEATDAELLHFMSRGNSESNYLRRSEIARRLPADFWTLDAKAAALTLVDGNRSNAHRFNFQLAIDDRDAARPPQECTITLLVSSKPYLRNKGGHYFLRVNRDDSYLAYSNGSDLRLCTLSYEDARKTSDIVWWLNRIRSRSMHNYSGFVTTTSRAEDEDSEITMSADGYTPIKYVEKFWPKDTFERWADGYSREVFLNFATRLVAEVLTDRLGDEWSQADTLDFFEDYDARSKSAKYRERTERRLHEIGMQFLDWCTPGQERISYGIVIETIRIVHFGPDKTVLERLEAIEKALPPPPPSQPAPTRTVKEIAAEIVQLPWNERDPVKRKKVVEQRRALNAEIRSILHPPSVSSLEGLREMIVKAMTAITASLNAKQVQQQQLPAETKGENAAVLKEDWEIRSKREADALEERLKTESIEKAREIFEKLRFLDTARAIAVAEALPEPKRSEALMGDPGFRLQQEMETLTKEPHRFNRLLQVLTDGSSSEEEATLALELLVPREVPARYPVRKVDDAVLTFLDYGRHLSRNNSNIEDVYRLVARSGRVSLFDRLAKQFETIDITEELDRSYRLPLSYWIPGELSYLAQINPARFNPRLAAAFKRKIPEVNDEIFWAVWAADLREFQPELDRLATGNADEAESYKASLFRMLHKNDVSTRRFHMARKIIALWSESDPLVRARILVAFAVAEAYEFIGDPKIERLARMKAELRRVGAELSPKAKREVLAFFDRINLESYDRNRDTLTPEMCVKLSAFVREELEGE